MPEDEDEEEIEVPEEKWYHVADVPTIRDELLEAILKVLKRMSRRTVGAVNTIQGLPIQHTAFEQVQTGGGEGGVSVSVAPGEREEVVTWDPFPRGIWLEVGTTDHDFTSYKWLVDEEDLFDDPQREPLGTFNSPYRFYWPILVEKSVIVEVTRDSDAAGSADYVSKVRGLSVSAKLYRQLKEIWGA